MTDQELFDQALNGIRAQGCRAVELQIVGDKLTGLCRYRTPAGAKCAAGHLIPDAAYHRGMKQLGFRTLYYDETYGPPLRAIVTPSQVSLVVAMQAAHDRGQDSRWERQYTTALEAQSKTDPVTLASTLLSAREPAEQELIVEEAFAVLAASRGLAYTRQPWAQPAVG